MSKRLSITIVMETPRDESEMTLRFICAHMENAFFYFRGNDHSLKRTMKEVSDKSNKKKGKKK